MGDCRLYLISPLDVSGGFAQRLERALDAGGPVAAFQFRVKRLDQHEAREALGREAQIGVTCHASRHLAMEAGEAGADYVAFGAFFPSPTKPSEHRPEPELLAWWQGLMEIPCVAIGGITPENCAPLVEAGADFLAVSHAVWGGDEADAVRAFAARLG